MGKIAFVFSGQGAQHPGMGKSLAEGLPAAADIFKRVDEIRPGTSQQCFAGTAEELTVTANTQPCMFAVELAAASALAEAHIRPDVTAGFSLGEVAALTFSGAMTLEDGFRLVCKRGQFMQEAAQAYDTGMVAVVKLDADTVVELCKGFDQVYPVNFNCPGQVSVAGLRSSLDAFKEAVKAAGGRAIPLQVAGGFHAPFMAGAAEKLAGVLAETPFSTPEIPVYSNYTGLPYTEDIRNLLRLQICNPVRWQDSVERMIAAGVDTFIELGPGKTLCGLIGKISKEVRTLNVEDMDSFRATVSEVEQNAAR